LGYISGFSDRLILGYNKTNTSNINILLGLVGGLYEHKGGRICTL